MFDAIVLEQKVTSLIENGKRNFAINLAHVDYLYSDSINKFINLNYKVLNVYGRLALLSPSEQVAQILQRAGIQNFLKIYGTLEELKRASDEIIQQTSAINVQDVKAYTEPEQPPVSEFEDFRSEIGKAIEVSPQAEGEGIDNFAQADSAFAPPSQPQEQPFGPGLEEIQQPDFSTSIPSFDEVPFNPNFSPATFETSGFDQSTIPPPPPITSEFDYSQMPSLPGFDSPPSIQPQFATPHYPEFAQQPPAPPAEFEPPQAPPRPRVEERKPPEKRFERMLDEDRFADDEFRKKKVPVAAILIPLVLLIILGGGVYLFLFGPFKGTLTKKPVVAEKKISQEIPQIAVKEEPKEETPIPEKAEEPTPRPQAKKPAPTPKRVQPKPRPRTTRTEPRRTTTPVAKTNKIVITSSPPSALVSANGKTLGKTPYTWNNPSVYGMVSIAVDKSGYETKKMDVEFTGGIIKKHFTLTKKAVATPPKKTTPPPVQKPPEKKPEPVKTTPKKPPPTVTPKPAPTPPAPSGGQAGTIFISSLPPMADVYMDGKKVGKTNIAELKITSGTHTMKFVKGAKELTKTMTFTSGKNASQLIRLK